MKLTKITPKRALATLISLLMIASLLPLNLFASAATPNTPTLIDPPTVYPKNANLILHWQGANSTETQGTSYTAEVRQVAANGSKTVELPSVTLPAQSGNKNEATFILKDAVSDVDTKLEVGKFLYVKITAKLDGNQVVSEAWIEIGEDETLPAPVFSVFPTSRTFTSVPAGYDPIAPAQITFSNDTQNDYRAFPVKGVSVTISTGSSYFEITEFPATTIPANGQIITAVRPKAGLPEGTYTGTLRVAGTGPNGTTGNQTFSLSFTVLPAIDPANGGSYNFSISQATYTGATNNNNLSNAERYALLSKDFYLKPKETGIWVFQTSGSQASDTWVEVWEGLPQAAGSTCLASNDDERTADGQYNISYNTRIEIKLTVNKNYYIRTRFYNYSPGSSTLVASKGTPNLGLSANALDLGLVVLQEDADGYNDLEEWTDFTVQNLGNVGMGDFEINVSDEFELLFKDDQGRPVIAQTFNADNTYSDYNKDFLKTYQIEGYTLYAGKSHTFSVRPKKNLSVGAHNGKITINAKYIAPQYPNPKAPDPKKPELGIKETTVTKTIDLAFAVERAAFTVTGAATTGRTFTFNDVVQGYADVKGYTAQTAAFTLTNTGTIPLTITDKLFAGDRHGLEDGTAYVFTASADEEILLPGASTQVIVSIKNGLMGGVANKEQSQTYDETLTFSTDNAGQKTVNLSVAVGPCLFQASAPGFPGVMEGYGTQSSKSFTIKNLSQSTISGLDYDVTPDKDSGLTVFEFPDGFIDSLDAGFQDNIKIRPKTGIPARVKPYENTIRVTSFNGGTYTVVLTFTVGKAGADLSADLYNEDAGRVIFPEAIEGYTQQPAQIITLTNTGTRPIQNFSVDIDNNEQSLNEGVQFFEIVSGLSVNRLDVGESAKIGVRPVVDLAAINGSYNADLFVSGDVVDAGNGTGWFNASIGLSFVVTRYELSVTGDDASFAANEGYAALGYAAYTLKNIGTKPLTNLGAMLTANSNFELDVTALPLTLDVNQTAQVLVRPKTGLVASLDAYTETLSFRANGAAPLDPLEKGLVTKKNLSAKIDKTELTLKRPATFTFADAREGYKTAPAAQTITVENTGTRPLALSAALNGADFTLSGFSHAGSLNPGETSVLTIAPKTGLLGNTNPYTAEVVIAGTSSEKTVSVRTAASFTVVRASFALNPDAQLTFADVLEGYSDPAALAVAIENTGTEDLTNIAVALSDDAANAFEVVKSPDTIDKNGKDILLVKLKEGLVARAAAYTAKLTVSADNAGTKTIALSARVDKYSFSVAPVTQIKFDNLTENYLSADRITRDITLQNTGTLTLRGFDADFGNANAFELASALPASLAPGKTAVVKIRPVVGLPCSFNTEGYALAATYNSTFTLTAEGEGAEAQKVPLQIVVDHDNREQHIAPSPSPTPVASTAPTGASSAPTAAPSAVNYFNPVRDGYTFANTPSSFGYKSGYVIPKDVYTNILGAIFGEQKYSAAKYWGGSCFGMSASTLLFNQKELTVARYGGETVNDLGTPGSPLVAVTKLIEQYQLVQYLPSVANQLNSKNVNNINGLVAAVEGYQTTGRNPVLLALVAPGKGHAVVAFAVAQDDTSYTFSLYDPNYPNETTYLVYDKDNGSYSFDKGQTKDYNGFSRNNGGNPFYWISFVTDQKIREAMLDPYAALGLTLSVNSLDIVVRDENGTTADQIPGAYQSINLYEEEEGNPSDVLWYLPPGRYTVESTSGLNDAALPNEFVASVANGTTLITVGLSSVLGSVTLDIPEEGLPVIDVAGVNAETDLGVRIVSKDKTLTKTLDSKVDLQAGTARIVFGDGETIANATETDKIGVASADVQGVNASKILNDKFEDVIDEPENGPEIVEGGHFPHPSASPDVSVSPSASPDVSVAPSASPTAQPTPVPQFTVTFRNGSAVVNTITLNQNAAVGTLPNVSKVGYTFNGWFTAANGGTKITDATTVAADTAFHAQYTAKTFKISFKLNKGKLKASLKIAKFTFGKGISKAALKKIKPTRDGYKFGGWYTDKKFTKSAKITAIAKNAAKNITLYAKWTAK